MDSDQDQNGEGLPGELSPITPFAKNFDPALTAAVPANESIVSAPTGTSYSGTSSTTIYQFQLAYKIITRNNSTPSRSESQDCWLPPGQGAHTQSDGRLVKSRCR